MKQIVKTWTHVEGDKLGTVDDSWQSTRAAIDWSHVRAISEMLEFWCEQEGIGYPLVMVSSPSIDYYVEMSFDEAWKIFKNAQSDYATD